MEIRDPVHGLIEYDDTEEQVISSRAVQRLRNIRQLAMACLVYPGALHTRFDHSLGVMHVAGEIARRLQTRYPELLTKDDVRNIRLAALLHDVGHGPFSHVSEMPLAQLSSEYLRGSGVSQERLHELVTRDLVLHNQELCVSLGHRAAKLAEIIHVKGVRRPGVAQSIVSGPLDADKLDYLLRDSYFCGVKYGVYDLDRVLDGLRVIRAPSGDSYLAVAEESVPAFEQHLMARYQMTTQVYRHRVRRSADVLLSRAILLAARGSAKDVAALYTYSESEEFRKRWLRYDDMRLIDAVLSKCGGEEAAELVYRLTSRRLPLKVCEIRAAELNPFEQAKLMKPEQTVRLETRIAERLGVRASLVIADVLQTDPPRPSSPEPGIDPEEICVDTGNGGIQKFHEVSDIFKANPLRGTKKLTIYLPFRSAWRDDREKEREELEAQVRRVLDEYAGEA